MCWGLVLFARQGGELSKGMGMGMGMGTGFFSCHSLSLSLSSLCSDQHEIRARGFGGLPKVRLGCRRLCYGGKWNLNWREGGWGT